MVLMPDYISVDLFYIISMNLSSAAGWFLYNVEKNYNYLYSQIAVDPLAVGTTILNLFSLFFPVQIFLWIPEHHLSQKYPL